MQAIHMNLRRFRNTVILSPGTCGRQALSHRPLHHMVGICGIHEFLCVVYCRVKVFSFKCTPRVAQFASAFRSAVGSGVCIGAFAVPSRFEEVSQTHSILWQLTLKFTGAACRRLRVHGVVMQLVLFDERQGESRLDGNSLAGPLRLSGSIHDFDHVKGVFR